MSTNELLKIFRIKYYPDKFPTHSSLKVFFSKNGCRFFGVGRSKDQCVGSKTNGPTLNTNIMCINSGIQIRGHANISFSNGGRPQYINIKLHTTEKAAIRCLLF